MDDSVGQLYDALKQAGQLDRTLIIYTSDNGFVLGEHGRVDKRTMYDESLTRAALSTCGRAKSDLSVSFSSSRMAMERIRFSIQSPE